MALRKWVVALSMIVATSLASAAASERKQMAAAPAGNATTRYCLHVEAVTGTRLETVQCWTREEWADQGIDIDEEWAKEGVRIVP